MRSRKICFVIPSLQAGGMERVMSELAGYFCQKNALEVHLVLFGINPEIFYSVPNSLKIHRPQSVFNNNLRLFHTIGRIVYLRRKIKTIDPETVLSFGEYWNSFVLLALLGLSFPVYISDRCSPQKSYGIFHSILRKWLYPKATGIIAQTEKARIIYSGQFKNKNLKIINNPISLINTREPSIKREDIILSVGRLITTKHHDRLIEIFSRLKAPGWRLMIVGDDALNQNNKIKLKSLINNYGLEGKVILAGRLEDVARYYLESKIFALTSSSEGFPNVIGEALSAGLPVISYDCVAGPSEMISDGENGYLIPVFYDELFAEKLQLLIDDETLRSTLSVKAIESTRKFSLETIGKQYLDFILPGLEYMA